MYNPVEQQKILMGLLEHQVFEDKSNPYIQGFCYVQYGFCPTIEDIVQSVKTSTVKKTRTWKH